MLIGPLRALYQKPSRLEAFLDAHPSQEFVYVLTLMFFLSHVA